MRRSSIAAAVAGIALLISAVVVKWAVAPAIVKLPGDTDTTRTYAGTAATLLNAPAVATGDFSHAISHNVPIVATHHTQVLRTHPGSALIADTHALTAAGTPVASSTSTYAVNRKSLSRGSGFDGVTSQTGITFNFPIHTQKHDYTGWISDTERTTPLHYAGTATRGGEHVYVFVASAGPEPLTNAQQLLALPSSVPKAEIPALAAAEGLSASAVAAAAPLLAQLPDGNVPLAYTYTLTAAYYVAPASGVVVDINQHEVRNVSVAGVTSLPSFPLADLTFTSTPASLTAAAKDARDKGDTIGLVETRLPWGLGVPGLVLLLVGLGLLRINNRRDRTIVLPPSDIDLTTGAIPRPRVTPTDQPTRTDSTY